MTDADNLRNQIERAKRFAASVTNENERIRFEAIASELRRELQLCRFSDAGNGGTIRAFDRPASEKRQGRNRFSGLLRSDLVLWHETDLAIATVYVCFLG
jgi:hypothetical protein